MASKDPEARRKYNREYMRGYFSTPERRQKQIERVRRNKEKYRAEKRVFLDDFQKDGCQVCTEKHPACLHAHHTDSTKKDLQIARAVRDVATDKFLEELKKCVCLCANCHAKVHAGVIDLQEYNVRAWPNGIRH